MQSVVIYSRHLNVRGGGEKVCLALASALAGEQGRSVAILTQEHVDPQALANYFHLDLGSVRFIHAPAGPLLRFLRSHHRVPGLVRNVVDEIVAARRLRDLKCDVFVNNTHQSFLANRARRGIFMCMFPSPLGLVPRTPTLPHRLYYRVASRVIRWLLHRGDRHAVDSYDSILANSAYTAQWVDQLWNRRSEVLYPICTDMADPAISKSKIILHVGRFFPDFAETHHKKQDWLIERFLAMPDLIAQGWELHFVGGVLDDPIGYEYLGDLRRRAAGHPISFHTDVPFEELKLWYNRASIYWHATGYGNDEILHPEKHEHFGISTVEAMSAGAIPIVINSAGQREIVRDGVDGFLWDTPDELESLTRDVATAAADRDTQLRRSARSRAAAFGLDAFTTRVSTLIDGPARE